MPTMPCTTGNGVLIQEKAKLKKRLPKKYPFEDDGQNLKNLDFNLTVAWNVMPKVGRCQGRAVDRRIVCACRSPVYRVEDILTLSIAYRVHCADKILILHSEGGLFDIALLCSYTYASIQRKRWIVFLWVVVCDYLAGVAADSHKLNPFFMSSQSAISSLAPTETSDAASSIGIT